MTELSPEVQDLIASHKHWDAQYAADVIVYAEGLLFASVCTSLDDEGVDAAMAARPATPTRGWGRSEENFADGGPNPSPCDEHPETRRHVLYEA